MVDGNTDYNDCYGDVIPFHREGCNGVQQSITGDTPKNFNSHLHLVVSAHAGF